MKDTNVLQVSELYLYASRIDSFTEKASSAADRMAAATEHDRCEAESVMNSIEVALDQRRIAVEHANRAYANYSSHSGEENYSPEVARRLREAAREAEVCYERALRLFEEAKGIIDSVLLNLSYVQGASYGAAGRIASAGDGASSVVKRGAGIIENEYKTLQI